MPFDPTELKTTFPGQVILPGDAEYDEARTVFYGGINKHPAAIVRVASTEDVARVITLAKVTGTELAVRSGGHSFTGYSVSEGGIVLDLKNLQQVDFDIAAMTVTAQSGLTAAALIQAADAHDAVIGFGDTGSVGIGGITLAGGIGFLVRKFGLTIDNLLAVELVTAAGEILQVDEQNHPDLFWAIRGGGGNFGVVTRFTFKLHSLPQGFGGMLLLPATASVIAEAIALAKQAPEELSGIFNVMPAPPLPFLATEHHGKLCVMAILFYAGEAAAGEKALAPFRALATPLADQLKPMRYKELFPPDHGGYHPTAVAKNLFTTGLDQAMAETILQQLQATDAPMRVVQLRVLGGAMARVPQDATAFAHRGHAIMANVAAFYETEAEKTARQAWVDGLANTLRQGTDGVYTGFLGEEGDARVHEAYPGATWQRLAQVKRQYDPTNLFHLNHNIPPANRP